MRSSYLLSSRDGLLYFKHRASIDPMRKKHQTAIVIPNFPTCPASKFNTSQAHVRTRV